MKPWTRTACVFKREWNAYFDSPVAYVFLVGFLMLTSFLVFYVSGFYEAGQADLRPLFFWLPWVFLLLVPAAAMRLWTEERRWGTLELLLTLPLTLTEAILGKFLAAWLFLTLGLALTSSIVFTAMYLGRPDLGVVLTGYIGAWGMAGAFLSVGAFTSACTRNQVISFVLSLLICLFLILAGWPPVTNMLSKWAPNALVEGVAAMGVMPHYDAAQRGVLDLRDVVYFASVMVVMLTATHTVLRRRRTT